MPDRPQVGLLAAIRRHWLVVLVVTLGVAIGATFFAQRLPSQYDSINVLSFTPNNPGQVTGELVAILVPKYQAYAQSQETLARVGAKFDLSRAEMSSKTEVGIPAQTLNLRIAVTDSKAGRSAELANGISDETIAFAQQDDLFNVVTVQRALPPSSPTGPPRRLYSLAGLAAGLAAGILAAAIIESTRPRVRSSRDLELRTGLRVIGRLPRARVAGKSISVALADAEVGAAVRSLRTTVVRMTQAEGSGTHVLLVTAPSRGEGSSTVASLLGASFSRLGRRVLVIDGDLLKADLSRRLNVPVTRSLPAALRTHEAGDQVRRVDEAGFDLLPTTIDATGSDILASGFRELLDVLSADHDLIILDGPDLLGSDTTKILATFAHDTILVVRRGTEVDRVLSADRVLTDIGAPVLGVVSNFTDAAHEPTAAVLTAS